MFASALTFYHFEVPVPHNSNPAPDLDANQFTDDNGGLLFLQYGLGSLALSKEILPILEGQQTSIFVQFLSSQTIIELPAGLFLHDSGPRGAGQSSGVASICCLDHLDVKLD
ncbi:hypothetical protein M758_2G043700 [Ceratodon purpureus]|uniref:Uncharacterized protein n=1 Tax=Ceratodon purpureus TaxID=3225 RepID=A0A8T0IU09_CERPU|nr:hypothetical protein KC19_2G044200 [Ceratodon purpureus]KAG0625303.1 hypothetical protein M758_2G043700 [Ceratodon purpureus]